MYYTSELIPAKFLILVAHFIICVLLLWNSPLSVKACLMEEVTEEVYRIHHTQLVVGLSVAIGMICFELLIFLIGLTMFHTTSALLCILHCRHFVCFCFFFNLEATALVAIYNQIFCSFCRIEIKCNRLKNKVA
jgi:hypothetical protein